MGALRARPFMARYQSAAHTFDRPPQGAALSRRPCGRPPRFHAGRLGGPQGQPCDGPVFLPGMNADPPERRGRPPVSILHRVLK